MHPIDLRPWLTLKTRKGRWTAGAGGALLLLVIAVFGWQREHDRLLRQFDTSPDSQVRARALSRLGDLGREEDLPAFLKGAHDPSPRVRRAAAAGLAQTRLARAVDPLGELLGDSDPRVQAEAATGLAAFGSEKSRAYLLNGYGRLDGPARKAIAAAVGVAGVADAVRHEARLLWNRNLKVLESGGLAERVGAVEELGRSGRGEAVERLLPLLGDDSVLFAAGAARGLGAARDPRALGPLIAALKGGYPVLREAAAEALGALGDPAAVAALQKMAFEGGPGAAAAVRALDGLAGSADARSALCLLAAEGVPEVAGSAARLMRERGGCATERILARLGRGGIETRAALAALEGLGGDAGADKIAALLDGPDGELRTLAARAIAESDAPGAGSKVARVLEAESRKRGGSAEPAAPAPAAAEAGEVGGERASGADVERKLARTQALGGEVAAKARPDERPARGLTEDDEATGDEEWLVALARAAGRLKPDGSLQTLLKLRGDKAVRVRAAVCEALGGFGEAEALEAVSRCLEERSAMLVAAAARGLARAGAAAAVPRLLAALETSRVARSDVIRELGELRARETVPKLAAVLGEGGAESVEAAVALDRIGDVAAVPALVEALDAPTTPARLEIIEALGRLGDAKAADAVRAELHSERPDIRAAAARALGKLGYKDASGNLDALRFDYYADVRRAVEEALGTPGRTGTGARE